MTLPLSDQEREPLAADVEHADRWEPTNGPIVTDTGYQPYRITLSRRMADAVTALGHEGTEVRRTLGGLVLRCGDPTGFLSACDKAPRAIWWPLKDVATKVRMAREGDVRMRGPIR